MLIISHRGNLDGPDPARENTTEYIAEAASAGFEVEVDVWLLGGKFRLGHDGPGEEVSGDWLLENDGVLWCHAKNVPALEAMASRGLRCFFHEGDEATITSRGVIWMHCGSTHVVGGSICVLPELRAGVPSGCLGVCTDYPLRYRGLLDQAPGVDGL